MGKTCFLATVMLFLTVSFAVATVVEVPLPELAGRYFLYETYQRSSSFELSRPPEIVHSGSLRLVGAFTVRQTWCAIYPSERYPEPFRFEASMPDPSTGGAWGSGLNSTESVAFDLTIPFDAYSDASWGFLEDATGEIILAGHGCPILDSCWPVTECSEAFVEQAYLVLDAEFPVPVDESTWGRIKALFDDRD